MSRNDVLDSKGLDSEKTVAFSLIKEKDTFILGVLSSVYDALSERGYNPTGQLVGYLLSGDPTYITSNHGARTSILKFTREELLEAIVRRTLR